MIKKYHNHTLQTNPQNGEEEPQNIYKCRFQQSFPLKSVIFSKVSIQQSFLFKKVSYIQQIVILSKDSYLKKYPVIFF